jgi:hypothetical protein
MIFLTAVFTVTGQGDSKRSEKIKGLRERILKAQQGDAGSSAEAAAAYKELFTYVGRNGLKDLTKDKDTSIALQAAWEVHKKVIKRDPPLAGRTNWVFDKRPTEAFLAFFAERVKAKPPAWWRTNLLNGEVFPDRHHAFITLADDVPEAPEVEVQEEEVVITVGKRTVHIAKAAYDKVASFPEIGVDPVALWGEEQSFFARPTFRGYPFKAAGVNSKTGEKLWVASVWAARRGFSSGPAGNNPVEIRREGDTVIVYGCESHGLYAEGFDAKTGKCRFRFCTCYWFNFSEAWGLK